jgi:ureidoacrylate peracid hydrolase
VRETGGAVAWIKTTFTEETRSSWSVYYAISTEQQNARRAVALAAGSKGHELWPELDVRADDLVIEKKRFSAFIQGSSALAETLRARGIDTILVTGTVTGVCCESTARDAMMLNFRVVMVSDGNAAMTDEEHNASLVQFYLTFGDVMPTDMLIGRLQRNVKKGLAAAE